MKMNLESAAASEKTHAGAPPFATLLVQQSGLRRQTMAVLETTGNALPAMAISDGYCLLVECFDGNIMTRVYIL